MCGKNVARCRHGDFFIFSHLRERGERDESLKNIKMDPQVTHTVHRERGEREREGREIKKKRIASKKMNMDPQSHTHTLQRERERESERQHLLPFSLWVAPIVLLTFSFFF